MKALSLAGERGKSQSRCGRLPFPLFSGSGHAPRQPRQSLTRVMESSAIKAGNSSMGNQVVEQIMSPDEKGHRIYSYHK
jgi:hypothetical protein